MLHVYNSQNPVNKQSTQYTFSFYVKDERLLHRNIAVYDESNSSFISVDNGLHILSQVIGQE